MSRNSFLKAGTKSEVAVASLLILLKINFPEFLSFCALQIGQQHPFWCQATSTGLACSIPENKESVIIFFENVSKEK